MARAFSTWLYGRDDVLKRTPLSGGWGSGKLGDITMDPYIAGELKLTLPKIYVECKNREGLMDESFWRWFETGKPATISEFIWDTQHKAKDFRWFLILKGRGTTPYVMMREPHGGYNSEGMVYMRHKEGIFIFFPLPLLQTAFKCNDGQIKNGILGA